MYSSRPAKVGNTTMYSSRVRTVRCSVRLLAGGGGWGVSAQADVCPGGCLLR